MKHKVKRKKCKSCDGKGIIYAYLGIRPRTIPLGRCDICKGTGKIDR